MGDWNSLDANGGNGFTLKCSLDPNIKEDFFAYTFGNKNSEWLSVKAGSLQELVFDSEQKSRVDDAKSKKKKYPLVISVPLGGKLERWFYLLKNPKHGFDRLRIHIYANQNQSKENTTLVFHNFKKADNEEKLKLFSFIPMPTTLYIFDYGSMEIVGARS